MVIYIYIYIYICVCVCVCVCVCGNISLYSNVSTLNESIYPCLVKFCWLFFLINFLPKEETINSEAYIEILMRLRARIRPVRRNLPIDNALLLNDNAWLHTSIRTRKIIPSFRWTTLLHPPDLVPSASMNEGLRGKH